MHAVKFLEEWKRMCVNEERCADCNAFSVCPYPKAYFPYMQIDPASVFPIVEQWSAAHPRKTRLQDFLEKYPDAEIDPDENTPFGTCAARLGYLRIDDCQNDCAKCWNTPLE